jgi:CRP-like cAMP-binding protein
MAHSTQSTIRNRLLSGLSPENFGLLCPHLKPVELAFKQVLIAPDEPIQHVYFPDTGIGSFLALFEGGGSLEVGMVGPDGMIGVPVVLGADAVSQECLIQVPGQGWRMETTALREAIGQSPSLHASLPRYVMVFLAQVSQTYAVRNPGRRCVDLTRGLFLAVRT